MHDGRKSLAGQKSLQPEMHSWPVLIIKPGDISNSELPHKWQGGVISQSCLAAVQKRILVQTRVNLLQKRGPSAR